MSQSEKNATATLQPERRARKRARPAKPATRRFSKVIDVAPCDPAAEPAPKMTVFDRAAAHVAHTAYGAPGAAFGKRQKVDLVA